VHLLSLRALRNAGATACYRLCRGKPRA
jgi:hypothetical protein